MKADSIGFCAEISELLHIMNEKINIAMQKVFYLRLKIRIKTNENDLIKKWGKNTGHHPLYIVLIV